MRVGDEEWEVVVQDLNEQRRPAPEARLLYQETEEGIRLEVTSYRQERRERHDHWQSLG